MGREKRISWSTRLLGLTGLVASAAHARTDFYRGAGSGILFPAPSQALVVNPAGLAEAPTFALSGLWRMDVEDPAASIVAHNKFLGLGAGYRQEGSATAVSSAKPTVIEAGTSLQLGGLMLGAVARKVNWGTAANITGAKGLDGDAGVILRLGQWRLGAVGRGLSGTVDRIDVGLGFQLSTAMLELNVKKPNPFNDNIYLVDAGVTTVAQYATVALGYDALYLNTATNGGLRSGKLHAGLSLRLFKGFWLDAFYRPLAQEWSTGDWAVGARVILGPE
jgi:hypothetical protein